MHEHPEDGHGLPIDQPTVEDRRSTITNWLLLAILVALIAIGITLVFDRGDDGAPVAGGGTTTTVPADTTTPGDEPTTTLTDASTTTVVGSTTTVVSSTTTTVVDTTTTTLSEEADEAVTAAELWIRAIADGEADRAWDLMAAPSRDSLGRDGFDDLFTALQEGFGAWDDASFAIVRVNAVAASGEGTLFVVTYVGTVEQEGIESEAAAALPVFVDAAGTGLVQPFLRGDLVTWIVPDGTTPAAFDDLPTFVFETPGEPMVAVFVDDRELAVTRVSGDADRTRWSARLDERPEVGALNVVTVIYLAEGVQHAEAVPFVMGNS